MPTMEGRASNLTESDKEKGKAVYGADNKKIGSIEKVMVDNTTGENCLRRAELRRLSRHRQRSLPCALEGASIRRQARRISFRYKRESAERCAEARLRIL